MLRSPFVRGWIWALAAAISFGVATPAISLVRGGMGAWTTAALLYFGAACFAAVASGSPRTTLATLRANVRTYVTIAVVGGMLAPAAFAAGLARAGPLASSLALNMEVFFSIALAVAVFKEQIGDRVRFACLAIVAGGSLLAFQDRATIGSIAGIGLVVLATALWAIDNAVSSTLRSADTRVTVFWKSLLGGTCAFGASRAFGEHLGSAGNVAALVAIGATGYGASLWCYLRAQHTFGVARTASVFAIAPFIGAIASLAIHPAMPPLATYVVVALMAIGIVLHATERHAHRHQHQAVEHAHLHRHDDDHHAHDHAASDAGEHLHPHRHEALVHDHEHAPDPHHVHEHEHEHVHERDDPRSEARAT